MKTRVSSKGRLVLPAALRKLDGIVAGREIRIERIQAGHYLLNLLEPRNAGFVNWLKACPEKGWCKAVDSESTAAS
jgi:bifunctional DNA-binding transcriptional regulator/antitoxin component of YhaV-PrlF toxin-antitoxin module